MQRSLDPAHRSPAEPAPRARWVLGLQLAIGVMVFCCFGLSLSWWDIHEDVAKRKSAKEQAGTSPKDADQANWNGFDNPWLDGYARWDGGWYHQIAACGYYYAPLEVKPDGKERLAYQTPVPFFPLYPLLMRGLAWPLSSPPGANEHGRPRKPWTAGLLAGMLISLLAGTAYIQLTLRWAARWMSADAALTVALTLLCYPISFLLVGPIYAEALFGLLALLAFRLLEDDRLWAAALIGALATATRPVGLGLAIGLCVGALERSGVLSRRPSAGFVGSLIPKVDLSRWRWSDLWMGISALGGFAYFLFLMQFGGDGPGQVAVTKVYTMSGSAEGWYMTPGPEVWLKYEAWRQLFWKPWGLKQVLILFHMGLAVVGFAALPAIIRRFGWGMATFVFIALGLPTLASKDCFAMARYLLVCFPVFAVVGLMLADLSWRLRLAVFASGLCGMGWFASRFARWYYVT